MKKASMNFKVDGSITFWTDKGTLVIESYKGDIADVTPTLIDKMMTHTKKNSVSEYDYSECNPLFTYYSNDGKTYVTDEKYSTMG